MKFRTLRRRWLREANREANFQKGTTLGHLQSPQAYEKSVGVEITYRMCVNQLDTLLKELETSDGMG